VVYRWAYEFGGEGREDYVPQNQPPDASDVPRGRHEHAT
jgi:hypothetical protein